MKRTRQTVGPDAILTADWHLRETTPICRTDDFWRAQWDKVEEVTRLQIKYNCPVIHAGDLFDHWKPSPYLLSQAFLKLPNRFWTIYGNHDLPQHNLDLSVKSGVYTLVSGFRINLLASAHWNIDNLREDLQAHTIHLKKSELLVWHIMTYHGEPPWPGCTDFSAKQILEMFPQFDLILTGHNHKSFIVEHEGRWLVNPGALTRQTVDQIDHRPCVYLWYGESREVKPYYLPCKKDVISKEHLTYAKAKDERIEAFINRLNQDHLTSISFERNLEIFEKQNRVRKSVMDLVWKAVQGDEL